MVLDVNDAGVLLVAALLGAAAAVAGRGGGPAAAAARAGRRPVVTDPIGALLVAVRRRGGGSAAGERESVAVGELVEAWAAGLRTGAPVATALHTACTDLPGAAAVLPTTAAAARLGDDLPAALRRDAAALQRLGARAVVSTAACVAVADGSGGRLADALDRIGDSLRAERQHAARVRAELASPRATARLLAALPVMALLLESGAGMEPFSVLFDAPLGLGLLAAGIGLDLIGLWWTARIARSATA